MMFDLTNQVAVVTGASSGLGVQFAHALARQGANIVIMARRKEKLESVAQDIREKTGKRCLAIVCDVTDTVQIKAAVKAAITEYGHVDILVNNAGTAGSLAFEEETDENWQKVMDVDLTSLFKVAREFGKQMIAQKYGRIINVASIFGAVGNNFAPAGSYHTSKGAIINMTRAMGAEWAKKGVNVNAIAPGFFLTEMTGALEPSFQPVLDAYCPMGRWGKLEELSPALIYLASKESSFTTGSTVFVDGGWTAI